MKQKKDPLLDKAIRLMEFLARTQELNNKIIREVSGYKKDGDVQWFSEIPIHDAIVQADDLEPGSPFLVVNRLHETPAPPVPESIRELVQGSISDLRKAPTLKLEAQDPKDPRQQVFDAWLPRWSAWAEKESVDRPARNFYDKLFKLSRDLQKQSEAMELVFGFGLLTWTPENHDPVQRHLYTIPAKIELNSKTAVITVSIPAESFSLNAELDMLDPGAFGSEGIPSAIKSRALELEPLEISRQSIQQLGMPTANDLSSAGRYHDYFEVPPQASFPLISYSPAIILRPRIRQGFSALYRKIAAQIEESGVVPNGLRPMLDPNLAPPNQPDPKPGALTKIGEEIFSPLPLNDIQKKVLERVDNNAQTLVQGPPGTGKTHTAAALLTHLLAQGKRILVTAQTDRALYEVRAKLPSEIKSLAVSVIGSGSSDIAELTSAVDTISKRSDDFDVNENRKEIEQALQSIDKLRGKRQVLINSLVESYSVSNNETKFGSSYSGTQAELVQQYFSDQKTFLWTKDFPKLSSISEPSKVHQMLVEWRQLATDSTLPKISAGLTTFDAAELDFPRPETISSTFSSISEAREIAFKHDSEEIRKYGDKAKLIPESERKNLVAQIQHLWARYEHQVAQSAEWVNKAFKEMRFGGMVIWSNRLDWTAKFLENYQNKVSVLDLAGVEVTADDPRSYRAQALAILEYLKAGKKYSVSADRVAKFPMFTSKNIKECRSFIEGVIVEGSAPTTVHQVELFLEYLEIHEAFTTAENQWSSVHRFDKSSSFSARTDALRVLSNQATPMVKIAQDIDNLQRQLTIFKAHPLPWGPSESIQAYCQALSNVALHEKLQSLTAELTPLTEKVNSLQHQHKNFGWLNKLNSAIEALDSDRYTQAYLSSIEELKLRRRVERRDELVEKLSEIDENLVRAIRSVDQSELWNQRIEAFERAVDWVKLGNKLNNETGIDANDIQLQINDIEDHIRKVTGELAALRAWGSAVGPGRLDRASRASLTNYVQQVKKLGKGTGKYAAQQRVTVQKALDECRSAVPVWIMPISRIVDQIEVKENLFDVVVVDEASQAGMEAAFLQYLAPKMVVIGDDMQVSPAGVGVNIQNILDLSTQYLEGFKFHESWSDPKTSLFDDAAVRFGGKLTLVEHRRCVPEIINFSNRIAYEPNKIALEPVRQPPVDRLAPFKLVHSKNGHQVSVGSESVNEAEAEALVDALMMCINDPVYDGKTFGVISLLGRKQAQIIEGKLLARLDTVEWDKRQITIGVAMDFQGAERDVMFLSMVTAVQSDKRIMPLTQSLYIQRFNVAVSRAKDQVWLFHSVPLEALRNKEDMRFQLLDHAYGVIRQGSLDIDMPQEVPDDERVQPFDSLFEQRVFNQIVAKGFVVKPQVSALGYSIDLVIESTHGKIAIECDGDHWHGAEAFERDLARQRDLERCGWEFFRIRESEYYMDKIKSMQGLWELLKKKDIHPSDWVGKNVDESENIYILDGESPSPFKSKNTKDVTSPPVSSEPAKNKVAQRAAVTSQKSVLKAQPVQQKSAAAEAVEEPIVQNNWEESYETESLISDQEIQALSREVFTNSEPYEVFSGVTKPVNTATKLQIVEGLTRILQVEGPMVGELLQQRYVKASGGQRASREVVKAINSAVTHAIRSKAFESEDTLRRGGIKFATLRLAEQPAVRIRPGEDRLLKHIPPSEILEFIRSQQFAEASDEGIMREVLEFYGRSSLTTQAKEILQPILERYRS